MTENVGIGGTGVNARFDPRELRAHMQENARLRSEIEDWRRECQIQADRYAWAHGILQELVAQCAADKESFSNPDYEDPMSMGRAITALFYQSFVQEKLDAMPDFGVASEEHYFFYAEPHGDRWRSECSCGWEAPVDFIDQVTAHQAWTTHHKVRHEG